MESCLNLLDKLLAACQGEIVTVSPPELARQLRTIRDHLEGLEEDVLDFEEIANHLYDGIYISDGDGNTLFVNKSYTRITGIPPERVLGRNVVDIIEEGLIYKNAVTLEVIKQKKTVNSIGESLVNKNKMLITGSPIFDKKGRVKKVVINNRAMTDLDEIKSQLEKTQTKLKIFQEENIVKEQELSHLRKSQIDKSSLVGECPAIQNIKMLISQVAPTDASVLITGPTGTGKEILANEVVKHSRRHDKPFIKINCSAIPENLLESELFGYEKGTFTGASKEGRIGLFEIANGGTLLLDEIGDMSMDLQCKLLRVLQEKEVKRIGAHKPVAVDVRIISATNKDIKQEIKRGTFREDLYYRINVLPINLPSLSERGDDIDLFKEYFLKKFNKKYAKNLQLNNKTVRVLKEYRWPGNIREFENVIERLVIIANDAATAHGLVESMLHMEEDISDTESGKSYKELVHDFERQLLRKALDKYRTTTNAAKHLQLDQSTIVKKKQRLGIE